MPTEEIIVAGGVAGTAYVAQKLFGKILDEMGDDLNKIYKTNREKLLAKATKKVKKPDDGAKPNLRVARDVIWNGAVTDDEVCAEYFGGLLAASRSADGKDDSALIYVDCIKALSSKQLHLHFAIYSSMHALLNQSKKVVNPGMQDEFSILEIWFASNELARLGINPAIDLNILHRQGLISGFATNQHVVGQKALPYSKANPTTFGVLLYAAALNALALWQRFGQAAFPHSETQIILPTLYAFTLEDLCVRTGLVEKPVATDEKESQENG